MSKLRRFVSSLGWGGLVFGLLGLAAIIIAILDFASLLDLKTDPMLRIILVALGLLMESVIVLDQRIRQTHSDTTSAFDRVRQALITRVPFQVLTSEKAIFDEAMHLVNMCKDSDVIRATGLTLDKASEKGSKDYLRDYFPTISQRIRRARDRGGSLAYRVVLGEELPPERRESIEKRREAFSAEGVLDRLVIRAVDTTWPLEIFLVGDSMIIGFLSLTGDLTFRVGFRVTNRDLVGQVNEWYDDFLWNSADSVAL